MDIKTSFNHIKTIEEIGKLNFIISNLREENARLKAENEILKMEHNSNLEELNIENFIDYQKKLADLFNSYATTSEKLLDNLKRVNDYEKNENFIVVEVKG